MINDKVQKFVGKSNPMGAFNSISDEKSLPGERDHWVSNSRSTSNRTSVSFMSSKAKRELFLVLEVKRKRGTTDEQQDAKKFQAELRKKSGDGQKSLQQRERKVRNVI